MAISEAHAGRRYPPTAPYAISAAKIAEFARALGDDNPAYAGDFPVAPPTFAAVISAPAWQQMFDDSELELALASILRHRPEPRLATLLPFVQPYEGSDCPLCGGELVSTPTRHCMKCGAEAPQLRGAGGAPVDAGLAVP